AGGVGELEDGRPLEHVLARVDRYVEDPAGERGPDRAASELRPRHLGAGLGRVDVRPGGFRTLGRGTRAELLLTGLGFVPPEPGMRRRRIELDDVLRLADGAPEAGIDAADEPIDGRDEPDAPGRLEDGADLVRVRLHQTQPDRLDPGRRPGRLTQRPLPADDA